MKRPGRSLKTGKREQGIVRCTQRLFKSIAVRLRQTLQKRYGNQDTLGPEPDKSNFISEKDRARSARLHEEALASIEATKQRIKARRAGH